LPSRITNFAAARYSDTSRQGAWPSTTADK
jgi:hypothetical protein